MKWFLDKINCFEKVEIAGIIDEPHKIIGIARHAILVTIRLLPQKPTALSAIFFKANSLVTNGVGILTSGLKPSELLLM